MTITLTTADIDEALPRIKKGLGQYLWLQAERDVRNFRTDAEYRRRFNAFYRVRRNREWQDVFYGLLEQWKGQAPSFANVLGEIHRATGRYEASFASKLVATVDPNQPVIDAVVLDNLGLRLPSAGTADRATKIEELRRAIGSRFRDFLPTGNGRYLVEHFKATYPDADVTEVKMLDFVLWKTRAAKPTA